jgi:hypothetical protein
LKDGTFLRAGEKYEVILCCLKSLPTYPKARSFLALYITFALFQTHLSSIRVFDGRGEGRFRRWLGEAWGFEWKMGEINIGLDGDYIAL